MRQWAIGKQNGKDMSDKKSGIKNTFCLLSTVYCLLILAGCATTSDIDNLRNNVTGLQVESINQKKEIAQIKTDLSNISKDITTLKEYSLSAMKESQSSILTQTSDLSKDLQTLKGRFDENKYFMDKTIKDLLSERELQQAKIAGIENELKELKSKIISQPAENKESSAVQEGHKDADASQPEAKNQKAADTTDPQKLYDDAQIDFKEKRYTEARQKFEKFSKDFPKHALAPNSYFWLGESYYADKKYEDAILAYEAFLKKYPNHEKTKGAMLKQAFAFVEMGDKKTGKVLLEKVMEKYPNSREADLAEKKIAELLSKNNTKTKSSPKKKKK
ncbi:MAG: tol-pal system protein YbgF [Thermodesulfovibrionales bacterium]|jgi:tol-pal system protein YbgF|nr:tol-pal system protein YbgF [Thermodesulfovibrionales bacterium]